jgi:hypothetical protein
MNKIEAVQRSFINNTTGSQVAVIKINDKFSTLQSELLEVKRRKSNFSPYTNSYFVISVFTKLIFLVFADSITRGYQHKIRQQCTVLLMFLSIVFLTEVWTHEIVWQLLL